MSHHSTTPEPTPHTGAQPDPGNGSEAPRTRVVVLFGGRSGEHGVSVATAGGVMGAIDRTRYEVIPVGITSEGKWVTAVDDPARWAITEAGMPHVP